MANHDSVPGSLTAIGCDSMRNAANASSFPFGVSDHARGKLSVFDRSPRWRKRPKSFLRNELARDVCRQVCRQAAARPWPGARRLCMYSAVCAAGNAGWLEILYFAVMLSAVTPRACSRLSRGARSKRSGLVTRRIAQTRTLAVTIRNMQSAPELRRGPQRGKQVLDGHAHSVVRVDKACVNDPISANDEGGGNREHPIVGTL